MFSNVWWEENNLLRIFKSSQISSLLAGLWDEAKKQN